MNEGSSSSINSEGNGTASFTGTILHRDENSILFRSMGIDARLSLRDVRAYDWPDGRSNVSMPLDVATAAGLIKPNG